MKLKKATEIFKDFFMHHYSYKFVQKYESMLDAYLMTLYLTTGVGNKKLSSLKLSDWEMIEANLDTQARVISHRTEDKFMAWALVYTFFGFCKLKGYKINDDVYNSISQKYETLKKDFESSKEFEEILMQIE